MRLIAFALTLIVMAAFLSSSGESPRPLLGRNPAMAAKPVPLDASDPAMRRVGLLSFLGGAHLTSPDAAFGGFSSMHVAGDRFTLLSDGGNIVRFRMGADWRPFEVGFGDLPGGPQAGWRKSDRDSESMTWDPASGRHWVGFEQYNAIARYAPGLAALEAMAEPAAMRSWPENGGPESLVRLRNGRFLVMSEMGGWKGRPGRAALMFAGDPAVPGQRSLPFVYIPPRGYDPTDMAQLPDGRVLVLNRAFGIPELFTSQLEIIDVAAIRRGSVVRGREVARLEPPLVHENFEGLAITRESGATIVWLVSDDNREWFQRTLLLKFRLELR